MIEVHSREWDYPVVTGPGVLRRAGEFLRRGGISGRVITVSSPRVWRLWGGRLQTGLGKCASEPILIDDRESRKNLKSVEAICRDLARARADRSSTVLALGGGVVGDVAGFAASCYMRGIGLVQAPTTLTGQVDSAIGAKTGVNLAEGKNLAGAFYAPRLVLADPLTLGTLSRREFSSGMFEVVKYAATIEAGLFRFLEAEPGRLDRLSPAKLSWVIARCQRAKARVVSRDERENGLRQVLNFGHTVGHAIEAATSYGELLHGEAVGWGMIAATLMAIGMDRLRAEDGARILRLIRRVGELPELRGLSRGKVQQMIGRDKKSRDGRVGWVLPVGIGKAEYRIEVPAKIVGSALENMTGVYSGLRLGQ
jgi:3-dehydroquinate synthase